MLQFYNNVQTKETKDKNLLTPCPQTPLALSKLTIISGAWAPIGKILGKGDQNITKVLKFKIIKI